MNREESKRPGKQRVAALVAVAIGALGSLGSMLYASRTLESPLLKLLFACWMLGPFGSLLLAWFLSARWSAAARGTLYPVMFLVAAGSLAFYGGVASGMLKARVGFVFLVVPLAAWLVIGAAFAIAAKSRRA